MSNTVKLMNGKIVYVMLWGEGEELFLMSADFISTTIESILFTQTQLFINVYF